MLTSHQVAIIWIYVKHVSCKNIILEGIKSCKKWLKIHANSLSDALVPSQKQSPAALGLRRLCEASAFTLGMPNHCQILARKPGVDASLIMFDQCSVTYLCLWTISYMALWNSCIICMNCWLTIQFFKLRHEIHDAVHEILIHYLEEQNRQTHTNMLVMHGVH